MKISEFIYTIPEGSFFIIKQMRRAIAHEVGAYNACPVPTDIFLRLAIEQNIDDINFPYLEGSWWKAPNGDKVKPRRNSNTKKEGWWGHTILKKYTKTQNFSMLIRTFKLFYKL